MEYIRVTKENLEKEHICCAISNDLLNACIEDSKEQAQNAPTPVTTYALFMDGEYLTNEQLNDTKFLKLASK